MKNRLVISFCIVLTMLLLHFSSYTSRVSSNSGNQIAVEIDRALYDEVEFFDVKTRFPRPTREALGRLQALAREYPESADISVAIASKLSELQEFDAAEKEMRRSVELDHRSPESLRRLATFYHSRARYADEAATLKELIQSVRTNERGVIFLELLELAQQHKLEEYFEQSQYGSLVREGADGLIIIKKLVEQLQDKGLYNQSLEILSKYEKSFPEDRDYFVLKSVELLKLMDRIDEAEKVFLEHFDVFCSADFSTEFYNFLNENDRYRLYKNSLQEKFRKNPADFHSAIRLFHLQVYQEYNYDRAVRIIEALEHARTREGGQTEWTPEELATIAQVLVAAGQIDRASRYFYTLYLMGGLKEGSDARESILYRLFRTLIDSRYERSVLASGDIRFYKDIARSDRSPGLLGGILSLVLANTGPQDEYGIANRVANKYFNRAAAYRIFKAYKKEYPKSQALPKMYADICAVLAEMGEQKLLDDLATEFQVRYINTPEYAASGAQIAEVYLKNRQNTKAYSIYQSLLDTLGRAQGRPLVRRSYLNFSDRRSRIFNPSLSYLSQTQASEAYYEQMASDNSKESPSTNDQRFDYTYSYYVESGTTSYVFKQEALKPATFTSRISYEQVLESYINLLTADKKPQQVLELYWNEIKKHPKDEGLYERFLMWLSDQNLIEDELRVYKAALESLNQDHSWQAKLARWYIKQKRQKEFRELSERLSKILDEVELQDYLERFVQFNSSAEGEADRELYLQLYQHANSRFPGNRAFVSGLIRYYNYDQQDEVKTEQNQKKYRELLMQYYFNGTRDECLQLLASNGWMEKYRTEALSRVGRGGTASLAYEQFRADTSIWLSDYEAAVEIYRKLVELYPGNTEYADRLVMLLRSFGQKATDYLQEAVAIRKALSRVYPHNQAYRTEAGELYAELGAFTDAREEWDSIIELGRGNPEIYLTTASIYWDYYQYDDALRVIDRLRKVQKQPNLYAFQAGAIYENKRDLRHAIAEYVKNLSDYDAQQSSVYRLKTLAMRDGVPELIDEAVKKRLMAEPDNFELISGYGRLLDRIGDTDTAAAVFRHYLSRSTDLGFINIARSFFARKKRATDELKAIERLAEVARPGLPQLAYRLQLASVCEQRGDLKRAVDIYNGLLESYPTNYGLIKTAVKFYWRSQERERALQLLRASMQRGIGEFHYEFGLELAEYQALTGRLTEEEATLRLIYSENPDNETIYSRLADNLVKQKKLDALKALGRELIARAEARQDRNRFGVSPALDKVYNAMLSSYEAIGDRDSVLEQYQLLINNDPEDETRLERAVAYARRYGMVGRLADYYRSVSAKSPRNYRWNLVLGRIYEYEDDWRSAGEEYAKALLNEPQRLELRMAYADCLLQQGRRAEVLAELEKAVKISGGEEEYLQRLAEVKKLQADKVLAGNFLRSYTVKEPERPADYYSKRIKKYEANIDNDSISSYEITGYASEMRQKGATLVEIFNELWRLRSLSEAALFRAQSSKPSLSISNTLSAFDSAIPETISRLRFEVASGAEALELHSALERLLPNTVVSKEDERREEVLLKLAQQSGFSRIVEAVLLRQLARTGFDDKATAYHNRLSKLADLYTDRGEFARCRELLIREASRDEYRSKFDYPRRLALLSRYLNDTEGELSALREYYRSMSGNLTAAEDEYIGRYFEILLSKGEVGRKELEALVGQSSPFKIQLIRFLVHRGERDLAYRAIASTPLSESWKLARTGEAALVLEDYSDFAGSAFTKVLGSVRIGDLIAAKGKAGLVGDDFYAVSYTYGRWLEARFKGREDMQARAYLLAQIENRPQDASAYRVLGRMYLAESKYRRAIEHFESGLTLAPSSRVLKLDIGEAYWKQGNEKLARQWWQKAIKDPDAEALSNYFKLLSSLGLRQEAKQTISERLPDLISSGTDFESIKHLIRMMVEPPTTPAQAADYFAALTEQLKSRDLLLMILNERLVPDDRRAFFLKRLVELTPIGTVELDATFKNLLARANVASDSFSDQYELIEDEHLLAGSTSVESDYENEVEEKDSPEWFKFRQELISTLLELNRPEEALHELDELERVYLGRAPRPGSLRLLRASAEIALGRVDKAMVSLEHYCGLRRRPEGSVLPSIRRCQEVEALLDAKKQPGAAAILVRAYAVKLASGGLSVNNFAGYARAEIDRGETVAAMKALELMLEAARPGIRRDRLEKIGIYFSKDGQYASYYYVPQMTDALITAAELAARTGRLDLALKYESQIPNTSLTTGHRLELARLFAVAGNLQEAVRLVIDGIAKIRMGNVEKFSAIAFLARLAELHSNLATGRDLTRTATGFPELDDETRILIEVVERRAAGKWDEARMLLEKLSARSLHPVIPLLRADLERSNREAAAELLAQALQADPAAKFELAYRLILETPYRQLIRNNALWEHDAAALYLAGRDRVLSSTKKVNEISLSKGLEGNFAELATSRAAEYEQSLLSLLSQAAERAGEWSRALRYEEMLLERTGKQETTRIELLKRKAAERVTRSYSLDLQLISRS